MTLSCEFVISLFSCRWPQICDIIPLLLEFFFFSKSYLSFADILYTTILPILSYPTTLLDPLIYYILYNSILKINIRTTDKGTQELLITVLTCVSAILAFTLRTINIATA